MKNLLLHSAKLAYRHNHDNALLQCVIKLFIPLDNSHIKTVGRLSLQLADTSVHTCWGVVCVPRVSCVTSLCDRSDRRRDLHPPSLLSELQLLLCPAAAAAEGPEPHRCRREEPSAETLEDLWSERSSSKIYTGKVFPCHFKGMML